MDIGPFQAEEFGELQRLVDGLYVGRQTVDVWIWWCRARYWICPLTLWRLSTCFPPGYTSASACATSSIRRSRPMVGAVCTERSSRGVP